jgi:quercetin dioxygenase-like cupin family protein
MRRERLENMVKGWFVGNFEPNVLQTGAVEVAVKDYQAGEREVWHYHKVATEVTVIVQGEVLMNDQRYVAGDIVRVEPGEGTDFKAVTKTTTVVVKLPGALNDKYLRGE